jgi:hypothetical protein
MKKCYRFNLATLMAISLSSPAYAAGNAAQCSGQVEKANSAAAVLKKCNSKVEAMQKSGVPDNFIEDKTGFCRNEDRALNDANRAVISCRQQGLGMTPRGPRVPLDPRTAEQ